jgi:hypothetical protein
LHEFCINFPELRLPREAPRVASARQNRPPHDPLFSLAPLSGDARSRKGFVERFR